MNSVTIKNLKFKYDDKIIFEDIDLGIKKGKITAIIGKNGCGKTTLLKLIEGSIKTNKIKYSDDVISKVIVYKSDKNNSNKTVFEEISNKLKGYSKKEKTEKLSYLVKLFNLDCFLNERICELNNCQKQIVKIVLAILDNPSILLLDDSLCYLDEADRINILNILKKYSKEGMSIIYVTNNAEDLCFVDDIVVLSKKVLLKGNYKKVLKEEKILNNNGFSLPFMVELSNRMKFYNLINDTEYDMQKMVDTLWK